MHQTSRRLLPCLLMLSALFDAGCRSSQESAKSGSLKVIATYSVLGDLVRNVANDHVEIITLVGGDGDAHTFEPSPKDGVALAQADVIFENGVGFESWLDKLHSASQSKAKRVVVSKGMKLLEGECCHEHKKGAAKHQDDDELDPHVWHDVGNAILMVEAIRNAMVQADPAHADAYRTNADVYLLQLRELDEWVKAQVAQVPLAQRKLVTNHDTFGYFAHRHGFKVVGTALTSFSTEASDPSAAEFAKLSAAIKAAKVPAIFAENVHNPKLMQRLANEAGVKLAPPLYTDALGKEGSDGDTYIKMIRHNVAIIVSHLKP